jgi:hypothetical protein
MRALQKLKELSALQALTQTRRAQGHCRLQQGLGFEKALECLSVCVCETKATGAAAAAAAADDRDPCLKVVTESESEEEQQQQQQEEEDGDDVQCFFFFFWGGQFCGIAKMAMIHWKIYSTLTTS